MRIAPVGCSLYDRDGNIVLEGEPLFITRSGGEALIAEGLAVRYGLGLDVADRILRLKQRQRAQLILAAYRKLPPPDAEYVNGKRLVSRVQVSGSNGHLEDMECERILKDPNCTKLTEEEAMEMALAQIKAEEGERAKWELKTRMMSK